MTNLSCYMTILKNWNKSYAPSLPCNLATTAVMLTHFSKVGQGNRFCSSCYRTSTNLSTAQTIISYFITVPMMLRWVASLLHCWTCPKMPCYHRLPRHYSLSCCTVQVRHSIMYASYVVSLVKSQLPIISSPWMITENCSVWMPPCSHT